MKLFAPLLLLSTVAAAGEHLYTYEKATHIKERAAAGLSMVASSFYSFHPKGVAERSCVFSAIRNHLRDKIDDEALSAMPSAWVNEMYQHIDHLFSLTIIIGLKMHAPFFTRSGSLYQRGSEYLPEPAAIETLSHYDQRLLSADTFTHYLSLFPPMDYHELDLLVLEKCKVSPLEENHASPQQLAEAFDLKTQIGNREHHRFKEGIDDLGALIARHGMK
jgi:hypothetical protein